MESFSSSKGRGGAHLSSTWGPNPFEHTARINIPMARAILSEAYECATMRINAKNANECKQRKNLLFKGIDKEILADALETVMQEFPQCLSEHPQWNVLIEPSGVHLLHIVVQGFLSALIVPRSGVNKAERRGPPSTVPLSLEDRSKIIKLMIPLEFPVALKLWKSASFAMNLPQFSKTLVSLVLEAMAEGKASFASMNFVLQEHACVQHVTSADILRMAALYGDLKANTVEHFASKHQPGFMAECKKVILELETMSRNQHSWRFITGKLAKNGFPYPGFARHLDYRVFCQNVVGLLKRLRGIEDKVDMKINFGWARVAVHKSAAKYYGDGSWKKENLHDVLWTVCAQRPSMRRFVVELLTCKYNDEVEAQCWKNFNVQYFDRNRIKCPFEERISPLSANPGYLSFPESVTKISMVSNAEQLRELEGILDDCALGDYPVVGLDAEWSSYISCSKASILQLSLRTQVFIIDLDVLSMDPKLLSNFFDKLFLSDEIIKIGYHFHEDLCQLRHAVNRCAALFHPNNIICIDSLVKMLREESARQPGVVLDGVFQPPPDCTAPEGGSYENKKETENLNESMNGSTLEGGSLEGEALGQQQYPSNQLIDLPAESSTDLNDSQTAQDTLKARTADENGRKLAPISGLSALCECVLGISLDKTEQCSVWDRRPLRALQVRYAALDAHCMLMLYDKCVEWASRLDIDVDKLIAQQSPIRIPLPMLWDD